MCYFVYTLLYFKCSGISYRNITEYHGTCPCVLLCFAGVGWIWLMLVASLGPGKKLWWFGSWRYCFLAAPVLPWSSMFPCHPMSNTIPCDILWWNATKIDEGSIASGSPSCSRAIWAIPTVIGSSKEGAFVDFCWTNDDIWWLMYPL